MPYPVVTCWLDVGTKRPLGALLPSKQAIIAHSCNWRPVAGFQFRGMRKRVIPVGRKFHPWWHGDVSVLQGLPYFVGGVACEYPLETFAIGWT